VQFYQRALEINDLASAKVLLAELEILKLAFKALGNRFAMGARHGGMLQAMLDRITVEFGGKVPLQTIEPAVPPVCPLYFLFLMRRGVVQREENANGRNQICILSLTPTKLSPRDYKIQFLNHFKRPTIVGGDSYRNQHLSIPSPRPILPILPILPLHFQGVDIKLLISSCRLVVLGVGILLVKTRYSLLHHYRIM
jgi:hypothetical protein